MKLMTAAEMIENVVVSGNMLVLKSALTLHNVV